MTITTRPDRRELPRDRLLAQSDVITAASTGESEVTRLEIIANQNLRNDGVVGHLTITRKMNELT